MRRLVALGVAGLVVVVLGVAQLVLPGIAAQHIRDQLARSGQVLAVRVDAFPAIELLWHQADTVVIRLGRYRPPATSLPGTLDQVNQVGTLDAHAQEVDDGLLTLHDATLTKRGNQLRGSATVTEADLRTALPILQSVTPVASADGRLTLRGTASLLGLTASVDATVSAVNGALIVAPDVPFGGFATITLFSSRHLAVRSVSAAAAPGGFSVAGVATVR